MTRRSLFALVGAAFIRPRPRPKFDLFVRLPERIRVVSPIRDLATMQREYNAMISQIAEQISCEKPCPECGMDIGSLGVRKPYPTI